MLIIQSHNLESYFEDSQEMFEQPMFPRQNFFKMCYIKLFQYLNCVTTSCHFVIRNLKKQRSSFFLLIKSLVTEILMPDIIDFFYI